MDFKKVTFIKSAPDVSFSPDKKLKEVLMVGRSNVGKSSLINALCYRKNLAFVSSKPGHTKLLNYFLIDDSFYLVDAPGYGYQKGNQESFINFGELMEGYFKSDRKLSLSILLFDSRRELNQDDIDIINYFKEDNIPFIIVLTKADKCNQSDLYRIKKQIESFNIDIKKDLFETSVNKERTIDKLRATIVSYL